MVNFEKHMQSLQILENCLRSQPKHHVDEEKRLSCAFSEFLVGRFCGRRVLFPRLASVWLASFAFAGFGFWLCQVGFSIVCCRVLSIQTARRNQKKQPKGIYPQWKISRECRVLARRGVRQAAGSPLPSATLRHQRQSARPCATPRDSAPAP